MSAPFSAKTERRQRQCVRGAAVVPSPSTEARGRRGQFNDSAPTIPKSNRSAAGLNPQAPSPRNRPPSPFGALTHVGRKITSTSNRDVTDETRFPRAF